MHLNIRSLFRRERARARVFKLDLFRNPRGNRKRRCLTSSRPFSSSPRARVRVFVSKFGVPAIEAKSRLESRLIARGRAAAISREKEKERGSYLRVRPLTRICTQKSRKPNPSPGRTLPIKYSFRFPIFSLFLSFSRFLFPLDPRFDQRIPRARN